MTVGTQASVRSGEVMFARYAYPPNQLGYCGPDDSDGLFDVAMGTRLELGARARAFDGAWAYLEIIASAARIEDPLDPRVVEAYWVGNELLEQVDPADFASAVRTRFGGERRAHWAGLNPNGAHPSVPHHGFHVFTVYPWVALLGRGDTPLSVLDRCRIRWGQVVSIPGDHVQVSCRPLSWDGRQLGLGPERVETARWAQAGRSPLGQPAVGDWVSLHWDWTCERLSAAQLLQLRQRTEQQLDTTNRAISRVASSAGHNS
ncbi:MAG: DUF6390 family protein [Actinomycetota bacterium]